MNYIYDGERKLHIVIDTDCDVYVEIPFEYSTNEIMFNDDDILLLVESFAYRLMAVKERCFWNTVDNIRKYNGTKIKSEENNGIEIGRNKEEQGNFSKRIKRTWRPKEDKYF